MSIPADVKRSNEKHLRLSGFFEIVDLPAYSRMKTIGLSAVAVDEMKTIRSSDVTADEMKTIGLST